MTQDNIIPPAPDELQEKKRLPGQDLGWAVPVFPDLAVIPSHKADSDSYHRSKDKSYKKKITQQKARMK